MPTLSTIWDLVDEFFRARALFMRIYEAYEDGVLQHAAERGVDRKDLRLDATAVSALLDTRQLAELRDRHLFRLKGLSHKIFRTGESTDIFDRYVTDIYHEISILKEEHLKVHRFAPDYNLMEEEEEVQVILDEVHELFPHKVHHVYALFQKAKGRLEQILPSHGDEPILIRSLYLFGDGLLSDAYPGRREEFYEIIYPDLGAARAYFEVGKSFLGSGFFSEAQTALGRCVEVAEKRRPQTPELRNLQDEARELLQRARRVPAAPPS